MDLDYEIIFDGFYTEDSSEIKLVLKIMKALICKREEQCIVLFNGCRAILKKRNKVIRGERRTLSFWISVIQIRNWRNEPA